MRKQKTLSFKDSVIPPYSEPHNYHYSLVQRDSDCILLSERIEQPTYSFVKQAAMNNQALPLYGRACPLCVPNVTSVALILSQRYILFCICCGRQFYAGMDCTDYNTWQVPAENMGLNFDVDVSSTPVEYALLESGLSYIEEETVKPQVIPKQIATITGLTSEPLNLSSPEYRRLSYFRIYPGFAIMLVIIFVLILFALCVF